MESCFCRSLAFSRCCWVGFSASATLTPVPVASMGGFYRVRIGEWRILYAAYVADGELYVAEIGSRGQVYRDMKRA